MGDELTDREVRGAFAAAFLQVFTEGSAEPAEPKPACKECAGTGDCPDCHGEGEDEDGVECEACVGLGSCVGCDDLAALDDDTADTLERAWEAAGEEGQVVS